jgi:hypothetical protein
LEGLESLRLGIKGCSFFIGSGLHILGLVELTPHLFRAFLVDDGEEEGAFIGLLGSLEEAVELLVTQLLVFVFGLVLSGYPADHELGLVDLLPQSRVLDVEGSSGPVGLRPQHPEGGTDIHQFLEVGLHLHGAGVTLKRIGSDSALALVLAFLMVTIP